MSVVAIRSAYGLQHYEAGSAENDSQVSIVTLKGFKTVDGMKDCWKDTDTDSTRSTSLSSSCPRNGGTKKWETWLLLLHILHHTSQRGPHSSLCMHSLLSKVNVSSWSVSLRVLKSEVIGTTCNMNSSTRAQHQCAYGLRHVARSSHGCF